MGSSQRAVSTPPPQLKARPPLIFLHTMVSPLVASPRTHTHHTHSLSLSLSVLSGLSPGLSPGFPSVPGTTTAAGPAGKVHEKPDLAPRQRQSAQAGTHPPEVPGSRGNGAANTCDQQVLLTRPLGVGAVMGMNGPPLFNRLHEAQRHLRQLRWYSENRWAALRQAGAPHQPHRQPRVPGSHGAKAGQREIG